MKIDLVTKTDEQIIVTYDDSSVQYIYRIEIIGWAKREKRLTTQREVVMHGVAVDYETIPISEEEYYSTLDNTEIGIFLLDRAHGFDT